MVSRKNLIIIANYISKKNIDINLISYDTKFKKILIKKLTLLHLSFQIQIEANTLNIFFVYCYWLKNY